MDATTLMLLTIYIALVITPFIYNYFTIRQADQDSGEEKSKSPNNLDNLPKIPNGSLIIFINNADYSKIERILKEARIGS